MENRNFVKLHGILIFIFGLVALFFPGITLMALGVYFAISILLGGIVLSVSSVRIRKSKSHWYLLFLEGIIGIIAGLYLLSIPKLIATVFAVIIGLWAILLGLIFLFSYFKRSLHVFSGKYMLAVGILSLILGFLIVVNPFESTRIITILIGFYATLYGIFSFFNSTKTYN